MKNKLRYQESLFNSTNGLSIWKWLWDENDKIIYKEHNLDKEIVLYI